MNRPDVFMPLYPGDYLAGTARLTTEQHGAYLLLIMDYWMNGPLPNSDEILCRISRLSPDAWSIHQALLKSFFFEEEGMLKHKRIEEELEKARAKKRSAQEKAKKAAEKRWGKRQEINDNAPSNTSSNTSSNKQAMHKECPSPSPSPSESISNKTPCPAEAEPSEPELAIDYLNQVAGKNFHHSKTSLKFPKARLNENFTLANLMLVVDHKTRQWGEDAKQREYLRPQTLFNEKFESYLQAALEWHNSGRPNNVVNFNRGQNQSAQQSTVERNSQEGRRVEEEIFERARARAAGNYPTGGNETLDPHG